MCETFFCFSFFLSRNANFVSDQTLMSQSKEIKRTTSSRQDKMWGTPHLYNFTCLLPHGLLCNILCSQHNTLFPKYTLPKHEQGIAFITTAGLCQDRWRTVCRENVTISTVSSICRESQRFCSVTPTLQAHNTQAMLNLHFNNEPALKQHWIKVCVPAGHWLFFERPLTLTKQPHFKETGLPS